MLWVSHRRYDPEHIKDVAEMNQAHGAVKDIRTMRGVIAQSLASRTRLKGTPDMEYDLSSDTFYVSGEGLITEEEAAGVNQDIAAADMRVISVYNKVKDCWFYLEARVQSPFRR